jgi:hypothetical protein
LIYGGKEGREEGEGGKERVVAFVPLTSLFYKIKCYFFIMAYR